MSRLAVKQGANTCADGNAGIASHFIELADWMVRPDGTVALVLPLTVLQGESWHKARDLWLDKYRDITVVTIAGTGPRDISFSADTGMGETLVIARKGQSEKKSGRGLFVTLRRCPASVLEASEIARIVNFVGLSESVRRLEDGPYGGTSIRIGNEQIWEVLDCPINAGEQWPVAGIADMSLAQAASRLAAGSLWLPGQAESDAFDVPMTVLGSIAIRGFYHMDINGTGSRGAFDILKSYSNTATYPALWWHDANRERKMVVEPDGQGKVRPGREGRAAEIWADSGHVHHNRDFRFNSNSLAVAFTDTPSIGGRAWPNVAFNDPMHEKAFTLWGNSTLGLLCYWWHVTKQQLGRGSIPITALESLPTLDSRRLSHGRLELANQIFDDIKLEPMLPFNEADHDPVRQELDRRLITEVLGLDPSILGAVDLLRRKLCAEPSIHGGKVSRAKVQ